MSDPNSSNLAPGKDGNTKHPSLAPKEKKKQHSGARKWCFTFNNYLETDIVPICRVLDRIAERYVFQREVGEQGTPHLQGAVWLYKKMRFTEFGLPRTIHWEPMRNEAAAGEYCQKEETSKGQIWSKGITPKLKLFPPCQPWQFELLDIINSEPDARTVHWRWDRLGGVGKSQFCKWLVVTHNVLVVKGGEANDLFYLIANTSMQNIRAIIWDLPRAVGGAISHKVIECVQDGMVFSPKYESCCLTFDAPHVIVLANEPPDNTKWLTDDRWDIQEIRAPRLTKTRSPQAGTPNNEPNEGEAAHDACHGWPMSVVYDDEPSGK